MIRVVVEPASIDVRPGQPVDLAVAVHNDGTAVQTVALRFVGVEPAWVEWPANGVVVVPAGGRVEVPATITLPAGFPAGAQLIGVEATVDAVVRPALASFQLVVASVDGVSFALSPASFRGGRKGKFRINIMNRGRDPITLRLSGRPSGAVDPDDKRPDLEFSFKPEEIDLRPGERVRARGVVKGRRPTMGAPKTRAMTIVAQGNSAPIHADGRFTQRPLLTRNTLKIFGLFVVLSMWAGALVTAVNFSEKRRDDQVAQDAAAQLEAELEQQEEAEVAQQAAQEQAEQEAAEQQAAQAAAEQGAAASGSTLSGTVTGIPDRGDVQVTAVSVGLAAADEGTEVVAQSKASRKGKLYGQAVGPEDQAGDGPYTTKTEPDGTWHLAGLPFPANYQVTLSKAGFGTRSYVVSVDDENPNVELDVEMAAGDGSISGTINGPDGPLGGAAVTVTDGTITFTTTTPTSGNVGEWSVAGLATPGSYLVTASLRGYGTETLGVELDGEENETGADLTLVAGVGSIHGTVTNGVNGISGILVTAASETITRSVTTLSEGDVGAFLIPQLPVPGTYTLTITGEGWLPQTEQIVLEGNATGVDYELKGTTSGVSGLVEGPDGPLPAVGVTVAQDDPLVKTLTDDEGEFAVEGLQPGTYTVSFERFGFETQTTVVQLVAGEPKTDVAVELEATPEEDTLGDATINGIVRSGSTGDPISGVTIATQGQSATSDTGGTFTLDELPAGTYDLTLTHARFQTTARTMRIGIKAEITVDITMLPLGGLQGQVTDLTATPISGVSVSVAAQSGTAAVSVPAVTTDANGEYSILQSFPTGSYTATFTLAGFGTQTREFQASAGSVSVADVQLVELGTITGAVQEPGGGVGGFLSLSNVTVTVNKLTGCPAACTVVTPPVYGPTVVNGSFTVTGLQPGDYRVTASHATNGTSTRDLTGLKLREVRDGGIVIARTPVQGAVNGQVYFQAGSVKTGLAGATVTAQIVTGFTILPTFPFVTPQLQTVTVTSVANGALIPGSSPARFASVEGYWEMTPPPVPGSVSNYSVSVPGFIDKTLAISSPTASGSGDFSMIPNPKTISGTVTVSPAAAVPVTATLSSSSLSAPLTSTITTAAGGTGSWTFPNLSPGTYTVSFSATGYHAASKSGLTITATGANLDADSVVPLGATVVAKESSIAVTVRTNTGAGALVSGAAVTLTALSGPSYSQTVTTGASGVASFTALTNRTYRVAVSRSGFDSATSAAAATATMIEDQVLGIGIDLTPTVTLQKHPDLTVNVDSRLTPGADADLSGATVTAAPVGGGAALTLSATGTAGQYKLTSVPPGAYTLTITAPVHETLTTAQFTLTAGTDVTRNEVVLKLGTIQVEVDKEVAGVPSDFLSGDTNASSISILATPTAGGAPVTMTRVTGTATFTATGVPAGAYSIAGTADSHSGDTDTVTAVSGTTATATNPILLKRFSSLTVNVQIAGPTAVNADSVTATPTGGTAIALNNTGTTGEYQVPSIASGSYAIRVEKSGYVIGTATQMVTAGTAATVTVTLVPYPNGTVTVQDASNNPINTATVIATPTGGGTPVSFSYVAASAGQYSATAIPTGSYTLSASASGYATETGAAGNFQSTSAGTITGTTTLTLTIASSITVTVKENSVGGANVANAQVILRSVGGTNPTSRVRYSGDDGAGVATFNELTPTTTGVTYKVTVSKPGYADAEVTGITLGTGASVSQTVVLLRHSLVAVTVSSRLSGGADTALATATVTAAPIVGAAAAGTAAPETAISVGAGAYFFPALSPGSWRITATAANHATNTADVTLTAGTDPGTTAIVLNRYPTLTVDVTGGLVAGPPDAAGGSGATVVATRTDAGNSTITLDEGGTAGTYTAVLPPGTYSVSAAKSGYTLTATAAVTAAAGTGLTTPTALELLLNPSLTVNLTSNVDGLLDGATVTATPSGGGSTITLPQGSGAPVGDYVVSSIAPGTYTITATAATHAAASQSTTVVAGVNKVQAVAINKYSSLTVTVQTKLGSGAASDLVFSTTPSTVTATHNTTGEVVSLASTGGANATYSVPAIEPGSYTVASSAANHAAGTASTTVVAGTNQTATVVMQRYQTVTVSVLSSIQTAPDPAVTADVNDATVTLRIAGGAAVPMTSAGSGDYTLQVAPGTYTASVSKSGYTTPATQDVTVALLTTPATLDFTLLQNPTLTVNVTSSVDGLLDGATVTAAPATGGDSIALVQGSGAPVGDYTVAGITPGTYTVTVTAPTHATATQTNVIVAAGVNKTQAVSITKHSTLTVTVNTVLGASTAGLDGATVTATNTTTGAAVTVSQNGSGTVGDYTVTAIPPGTYSVTASAANHSTASAASNVTVSAGSAATSTVDLPAYPTLTATVTGGLVSGPPNAAGGSGATVVATRTDAGASTVTLDETATAGTYTAVLPPGTYTVTASKSGYTLTASVAKTAVAGTALTNAALELLLNPSLTVNVTSDTDGLLDGATVSVAPSGGGAAVTAEQGSGAPVGDYIVGAIAPGAYVVTVTAARHATATQSTTVVAGVNKTQAVTINKASTLTVHLQTVLDGAAAADLNATASSAATVVARETTTGEEVALTSDGVGTNDYSVTAIAPGTYVVTASAANHESASSSTITMAAGTDDTDDVITLNAYPTLTVTVTGDPLSGASAALAGATVTAQLTSGGPAIAVPETGTAGTYRVSSLTPGTYTISASKSGWSTPATLSRTATAGAAMTASSFALTELPTITVNAVSRVVVDGSNIDSPLLGASVIADPDAAGSNLTLTHVANGTYTATASVAGTYDITVSATGHTTSNNNDAVTVTLGAASPGAVTINLTASTGTISGTVRDITGAALSGVTVTRNGYGHDTTLDDTTSAGDGTYSFSSVPALTWSITFSKDGYSPLTLAVTVGKGETVTTNAVLPPLGASVVGRIYGKSSSQATESDGNPRTALSGVTVTLSGGSDTRSPQTVTTTNGLGDYYYLFSDLQPDDDYILTFTKTNYQTVTVNPVVVGNAAIVVNDVTMVPTEQTVTINATNSVSGFASGAVIRITNASLLDSPGYEESGATNGSGAATIANVPPGAYTVSVTTTPSGFATPTTTCSSGAACTGTTTLTVSVGSGATLNIAFTPSGSASGTLVLNDDEANDSVGNDGAAAGGTVTISKGGYSQSATVATNGTWSLSSIPQDTGYTYTFSLSGYETLTLSSQTVDGVEALGTRTLDKLSSITVTIVNDLSTALDATTIGLVTAAGGSTRITDYAGTDTANGSGSTYTFENLTPGTVVHVVATKSGHTQVANFTTTLEAGVNEGVEGLTVTLVRDATVNVSVLGLGGGDNATVTLSWTANSVADSSTTSTFTNVVTGPVALTDIPAGPTITATVNITAGSSTCTINTVTSDIDTASFTVTANSSQSLIYGCSG